MHVHSREGNGEIGFETGGAHNVYEQCVQMCALRSIDDCTALLG